MAYAALVRGACACGSSSGDTTYSLAWFCIQSLLSSIASLRTQLASSKHKGKAPESATADFTRERIHRLELTLISTLSSLPLSLLAKALEEVGEILKRQEEAERERKEELGKAVFGEILEGVGDREKEYAMRWWYARRVEFGFASGDGGEKKLADQVDEKLKVGDRVEEKLEVGKEDVSVGLVGEKREGEEEKVLSRL